MTTNHLSESSTELLFTKMPLEGSNPSRSAKVLWNFEKYMQIIYETVNHWNRENGINPWRYIGSDEHNKLNYLGSNKQLLEDI